MGRAIVIYDTLEKDTEADWVALGCCTLAYVEAEQPDSGNVPIAPTPFSHTHHHAGSTAFSQFAQAAGVYTTNHTH